jgi:hypothetical protein
VAAGFLTQDDNSKAAKRFAKKLVKAGYDGDIFHYHWPSSNMGKTFTKVLVRQAIKHRRKIAFVLKSLVGIYDIRDLFSDGIAKISIQKIEKEALDFGLQYLTILGIEFLFAYGEAKTAGEHLARLIPETFLSDYKRIDLVGHSLGARLQLNAAAKYRRLKGNPKLASLSLYGAADVRKAISKVSTNKSQVLQVRHIWNGNDRILNVLFRSIRLKGALGDTQTSARAAKVKQIEATDLIPLKAMLGHDYSVLPANPFFRL